MWRYRLPRTTTGWVLLGSWMAALLPSGASGKWLAWGMFLVPLGVTAYVLMQLYQEQRWKSERFTNRG